MNKPLFRYITVIAILAVVALQGMWFSNSYHLLENELYDKINNAFLEAQLQESSKSSKQFKGNIPNGTVLQLDSTKIRAKNDMADRLILITALHSIHHEYNIPLNYQSLDSCYREELDKVNLGKLHFRIDSVDIDSTRYKYVEDFAEDSSLVRLHNEMQTQIFPIREDFYKGIQATIDNPYKLIILQMRMFLIGTVLLLFIVIYCLVQQIKVIVKQNKIAKIREDFSYAMIHDMKTPLSSILMGTRILRSGKLDDKPERKEKYFDIMEDEEEHLLALVNKVLTLSKLEEGKLLLEKKEVSLRHIIEDLTEKFTAKAEKPVEFILDLQEEKVYADEEFLKEAVSNLIDNAIKYSEESVQIKISSSASSNGYTHISVKDNGMGIPLKEQGKIFEKFERASAVQRNRKGGAPGFGLGLNYVFHVVRAHHGSVKLESIEGEYSEFTINIPQQNKEMV